jgi:hypothetical protein
MKTNRAKKSAPPSAVTPSNINFPRNRECFQNNKSNIDSYKNNSAIAEISRYHNFLESSNSDSLGIELCQCFAVRLSLFLMDLIGKDVPAMDENGYLKKYFYRQCIEKAAGAHLFEEINDNELLTIYIKQCLHLLKICGIIKKSTTKAFSIDDHAISVNRLYYRLLKAFWVDADWADLFPSDAESARELKLNKSILKDLLLKNSGKARLDKVANEFFEMTGFTENDNLFMISFLDFYFFTWLKHFNLISYIEDSLYSPVCISVTGPGKKILKLI